MMSIKRRPSKPLPLKQRTSSVDARRDYNVSTWYSVLGLLKIREYFVTVDHFSIWRRHLAWAMEDGKNLRDYMTQRYASSMVFMSLLLSTELNILFNSSQITTNMRHSLQNEEYWLITFWIGIMIITSAVLTLLSLISTYTAWCMVSSVHENNAHCIFRSSIGQYVAELPGRLIVGSIYSFLLWVMMFLFVLLPVGFWSIALVGASVLLFAHTICCFSAFGRIIMHSGAMHKKNVFEQSYERNLLPHSLHAHLLAKARANLSKNTSILRQYRSNSRPIDHFSYSDHELHASEEGNNHGGGQYDDDATPTARVSHGNEDFDLNHPHSFHSDSNLDEYPASAEPRRRADSTVRFADEVDMVTSSPPKETPRFNRAANNDSSMMSVPEGDTPLSQTSSSGDTTESMTDESKSTITKQEESSETTTLSKPPRPGIVRRDRSNTTANEGNLDAIFQIRKPKPSARPNKTPPKTNPRSVYRAESDSALNITDKDKQAWSHKRSSLTDTKRTDPPLESAPRSTGSLPSPWPNSAPGLSVLENAAKLQRQWQNSHIGGNIESYHDRGGLHSPLTPSRNGSAASLMESEASLQQLWVSSSPQISGSRKHEDQNATSERRPATPTADQNKTSREVLPSSNISRSSSADALSSRGSTARSVLSEEEEEAYLRDYGSFDDLAVERDLDDDGPWETNTNANEGASLLDHDRLENTTTSYMSLEDGGTPKQSGTARKHGRNG